MDSSNNEQMKPHIERGLPEMITCLLPAYNEANNLPKVVSNSYKYLKQFSQKIEILIVDDGSSDNTLSVAQDLALNYPVSIVKLSRNFGKEIAISAGLDKARGDVVIIMDADGQHPLSLIDSFIEHWRAGYDMAYGVRANRDDESFLKKSFTNFYYRLLNKISDVYIHPSAGDFRLLSRNVVDALISLPERTRMMKGLYAWVGFKSKPVMFNVESRLSGTSSFKLKDLTSLAFMGITSFSNVPLKIWTFIGAIISLVSFFYGITIFTKALLIGVATPGFPTLAIAIFFLGGIQLLSIGILGDYLSRVFTEVKKRPLYILEDYQQSIEQEKEKEKEKSKKNILDELTKAGI